MDMAKTSDAMRRAIATYKDKHDEIRFTVVKGGRDALRAFAKAEGLSLQAWLIKTAEQASGLQLRDKENPPE